MKYIFIFYSLCSILVSQTTVDLLKKENQVLKGEIANLKQSQQQAMATLMELNLELKQIKREKQSSPSVAVVNIDLVFQKYNKRIDIEKSIHEETQANLQQIETMEKKAQVLRQEVEQLRYGTPLRSKKETELEELVFQIEYHKKRVQYFFNKKTRDVIVYLYSEICSEISCYAQDQGIDQVNQTSHIDASSIGSAEQMRHQIRLRKVLYSKQEIDATDIIISRLNQKYKKEKILISEMQKKQQNAAERKNK